jgi:hypothetical protein
MHHLMSTLYNSYKMVHSKMEQNDGDNHDHTSVVRCVEPECLAPTLNHNEVHHNCKCQRRNRI